MNKITWLLHLYPHRWRQRYEEEFTALLEQQEFSFRDIFDIVIGAIDAHLHPHIPGTPARTNEVDQMLAVAKGRSGMEKPNYFRVGNYIPGRHIVDIVLFRAGEPGSVMKLSDGTLKPAGVSVAKLRERFGGDEGTISGMSI